MHQSSNFSSRITWDEGFYCCCLRAWVQPQTRESPQANEQTNENIGLKVALSQKVQDSFFIDNFAIRNIPKNYLKLLHPLHSIDKMSIFKTFTFTCVVYLQVQEVGFMSSTNNFIS